MRSIGLTDLAEPGNSRAGQLLGRLHFPERPDL
jgi:hypothetical protein